MSLMNSKYKYCIEKFNPYRCAELDELVEEYLIYLSSENDLKVEDLGGLFNFKELHYLIDKFCDEVLKIWRENENKNI